MSFGARINNRKRGVFDNQLTHIVERNITTDFCIVESTIRIFLIVRTSLTNVSSP